MDHQNLEVIRASHLKCSHYTLGNQNLNSKQCNETHNRHQRKDEFIFWYIYAAIGRMDAHTPIHTRPMTQVTHRYECVDDMEGNRVKYITFGFLQSSMSTMGSKANVTRGWYNFCNPVMCAEGLEP